MRMMLILVFAFVTGCMGFQTTSNDAKWPEGMSKSDGSQSPVSASMSSEFAGTSDYRVCLAQNEGLPGAAEACAAKLMAGMPGQLQVCGYGYSNYQAPEQNCRVVRQVLVRAP